MADQIDRSIRAIAAVRSTLWFVPAVMTVGAIVLALATVRLDESLGAGGRANSPWLFGGGAEGARGVLSAIAGTMMTVAATVFSIMVVALQLASSQFTPRLLRSLMRDRGNQIALGAFIGTFTYSLLVLRSVRSAPEDGQPFVPAASVTISIICALVSIALLIYFIHHSARSMQASRVIDRAAADALRLVERLYANAHKDSTAVSSPSRYVSAIVVQSDAAGYLDSIDMDRLVEIAGSSDLVLRLEQRIGVYLFPGMVLLTAGTISDSGRETRRDADAGVDIEAAIRRAFVITSERHEDNDLIYSAQRLADIALKALSPGINDPTTAILCIDRLAEIILQVGRHAPLQSVYADGAGTPRVIWDHDLFEPLVRTGFEGISHYGAGDVRVLIYLTQTIGQVVRLLPGHRLAPLRRQVRIIEERGEAQLTVNAERDELRDCTAAVLNIGG